MSTVRIIEEHEGPRGWRYDAEIDRGGEPERVEMTLAYVDHDHWSGGRVPPSKLAQRVLEVLLEFEPSLPMPERFDASTARRWSAGLDDRLLAEFGT